jgi:hypothetical protein
MHRGFLLEASDKLLKNLGYGPGKPSVQINNVAPTQNNMFVGVEPELLAAARARMLQRKENQETVIDALPAPTST